MIETGRCALAWSDPVLTTARPATLTWDDPGQPWVLWALGRVEDNTLTLSLELRRDGDRMPVDEPELILGGDDGLVIHHHRAAPFDDRHAYPWVNLFRGEGRTLGVETGLIPPRFSAAGTPPGANGYSPIRVPLEELPQFLDRLYHLPCVPELDLPPDIGPTPQRLVPTPHLKLSEQADEAAHATRRRPGSSYMAEAELDYAGAQVKPLQGGWFIFPPGSEGASPGANPSIEPTPSGLGEQPPPRKARAAQPMGAQADLTGDTLVPQQAPARDTPSNPTPRPAPIRRDLAFERRAMSTLLAMGLRSAPATGTGPPRPPALLLPAKRMPSVVRELLGQGWVISIDRRVVRNPGPVHLSVTTGIDWFELRGSVRYSGADGDHDVPLPEILAASRAGKAMITLEDGSCAMLPHEWLSENRLLAAVGTQRGDHVGFRHNQAALLEALLTRHPGVEIDAKFEAIRQRLRRFDRIAPLDASPTFHGQLRHYQRDGLGWLRFLRWLGVGGVLADDMGLGKTIQVLAMLEARYSQPDPAEPAAKPSATSQPLPSLIVVPRSAVFNWVDEARRFAPNLDLLTYTGGDRHALRDAFAHHHVVVTSYGVMRKDIAELQRHRFDYVVLDEAQAIKNPGSQVAKAARLLLANHRLALTGTPVENHLGDLWSIFEFLNPGMLGSGTRFARLIRRLSRRPRPQPLVVSPVPANVDTPRPSIATPTASTDPAATGLAQLTAALRPFILRRTKQQVLQELPDKTEQTILCHMNAPQRQQYDQLLHYYRSLLLGASTAGSDRSAPADSDRSTMMVLEALLRLRQAACHPGLIDPARADDRSAKLDELIGRLEPIVEAGHKALVFSQFTSLLAIVRKRLDERQFVYEYLDGQTRNRKQCVERFQTDPDCPVFLISLKAGGLALNLTAAEYVFLLDPWWNPAVEAQAIGRAHRIGQTRHVFAYRLICQDTVEQRITQLQARKRDLAEAVIRSDNDLLRNLTRDEMLWLLR
jgi:superfamily II DNA or RNA helicase